MLSQSELLLKALVIHIDGALNESIGGMSILIQGFLGAGDALFELV